MRQIVLYISLVLSVMGCSDAEYIGGNYCSIASLWSYASRGTVQIADDISICGYVVANDKYGELNSAIVVADDSAGVAIELDIDDTDLCYPLYSGVEISCSGLWLGVVGPKLILGAEPTGDYVVDRIPSSKAQNHISLLNKNNDTPTIWHRMVAELEYRDVLSFVAIDNLSLVPSEHGMQWADIDPTTGRPITTVRHFLQDNQTLCVVTDARCQYANEYIPESPLTLTGVVDWYAGDIALRIVDHGIELNY